VHGAVQIAPATIYQKTEKRQASQSWDLQKRSTTVARLAGNQVGALCLAIGFQEASRSQLSPQGNALIEEPLVRVPGGCLNVKHWMGTAQQGREEQVSVDTMAAGACGSYSPALTLELDEPVVKRGSEVTYRSVMTSATAAIPFRSLLDS